MSDLDQPGLTKISFNATARTVAAMDYAAERHGISATDVLNRAMQLYAGLVAAGTRQSIELFNVDESVWKIHVEKRSSFRD